MHRRALLLFVLFGCASPESSLTALAQGPSPLPPTRVGPPAPTIDLQPSGDPAFDAWRVDFVQRQAAAGWPADFLRQQLSGLTPDPKVIALDSRQPEFSKPVGDYLSGAVSADRIAKGRAKRDGAPWLPGLEGRYGVPGSVLVAIWGMESAFGAIQGDMDVVRSLATLAAEGRRRAWAEGQLLAALTMLKEGDAGRGSLQGSWAGAMGQTQFMPDTYLSTAIDGDGDGRRDIWGSPADALASAANLLAKAGWRRGQSWAREVILPANFDYGQAEGPKMTPAAWGALGVRPADGGGWSAADAAAEAQLLAPAGHTGPAFLALPNHFVIRRYNNSTAYALAVGMLADRISGGGPLVGAWPAEPPMAIADRKGAQMALARLGFDPGEPDGVIGTNTRTAVRAYQRARGLIADGYLDAALAQRLIAETAATRN